MNQKGISSIIIILIIVGILVVAGGIYWWQKDTINKLIFGRLIIDHTPEYYCNWRPEKTDYGPCAVTWGAYFDSEKCIGIGGCGSKPEVPFTSVENCKKVCENKTDETTDWQTYRNEEYGFEVKFPSDLVLQKNTGETYISFLGKLAGKSYFLQFGYISQSALNTMGISYCGAYPDDSRCENFTFNNLQFLIDWNIETEGAFTQSRAEILKPEGGMVVISILHSPSQDIKLFFRQILSTFKFTK